MSNKATIQRTTFIDHPSEEKSYGFRIYDDNGQSYCNTLKENIFSMSPQEFLDHIQLEIDADPVALSIFDFALERGIYIDEYWYKFDLTNDGPRLICT